MTYTPEQLKGMSDSDINVAIATQITKDIQTNEQGEAYYPNYCRYWEFTGPLRAERRINMDIIGNQWSATGYCYDANEFIQVMNENPLRAICEVLLQLNQE